MTSNVLGWKPFMLKAFVSDRRQKKRCISCGAELDPYEPRSNPDVCEYCYATTRD